MELASIDELDGVARPELEPTLLDLPPAEPKSIKRA